MGLLKDMFSIKYSFTKPFKDVANTIERIKEDYMAASSDAVKFEKPENYDALKEQSRDQYLARLASFKRKAEVSIRFGFFLKLAGGAWATYSFILLANAFFTRAQSFGFFLSCLSGLIVFGVGHFWINSYKEEIKQAELRAAKGLTNYKLEEKEEHSLLKNFITVKRTALAFFFLSAVLVPYYLLDGELMNSIVSLSFLCVMVAQLFKYSLWIYQIQTKNLCSVDEFVRERGYKELLNPYL